MAGLVAALLVATLMPGSVHAEAKRAPVLGVDRLPEVAELECRSEALTRWLSRGITGTTLLLVDVSADIHPLGEARSARLADIRRSIAAGSPEQTGSGIPGGLCTIETAFVRAAVDLGIVREVVWIVPFDSFRTPDPAGHLRGDLLEAGFSDEEIGSLALRDKCLRGTAGGFPLAVCGIDGLPALEGPVLFSADTGFVLAAVAAAATNPVAEIRRLLGALAARRYPVVDAVLSAGVVTGRVPPEARWVGETLAQALQDPTILAGSEKARRWDRLQGVMMLLGQGRYNDMFHQAWPLLQIHPDDPALHLLTAEAQLGLGDKDDALERAEEACRLDPAYCYGLPGIGMKLLAVRDLEGAQRFFDSGQRLRPGMLYGQFDLGLTLLWARKPERALKAFEGLSDGGLVFPAAFLAGDIRLQQGDRQAALRLFDRALEGLRFEPEAEADHPETIRAIRAAAQLYREEGAPEKAALLEANPRLTPPANAAPAAPPAP